MLNTLRRSLRALVWGWRFARLGGQANLPDLFYAYGALLRHPALERVAGGWHYQGRFYPDYLTVGGASHAIAPTAVRYCQGQGIDVGAGLWPLPGAQPVDIWRGPGAATPIGNIAAGSLDFVFSSHCLEHIAQWEAALDEWIGKLKPGGTLFLYLPHPECAIWHRGSPFVGDDHQWRPTPAVIRSALAQRQMAIVAHNDGPDAMQSFFYCAKRPT